jgi:lipid-binding SYLF domain-containing protein
MKASTRWITGLAALALFAAPAWAQNQSQAVRGNNAVGTVGAVGALEAQAEQTIATFKQQDPSLDGFFRNSAGYAVFPTVTEGAFGVGAAHSTGLLYQKAKPVGEVSMSKVTIGAQAGGQTFSELIFFETPQVLQQFKGGNYEFSAETSAVAAGSGAGKAANYRNGVAVFTFAWEGLMAQAAMGGQKFTYQPLSGNRVGQGAGLPGASGTGSQGTQPVK